PPTPPPAPSPSRRRPGSVPPSSSSCSSASSTSCCSTCSSCRRSSTTWATSTWRSGSCPSLSGCCWRRAGREHPGTLTCRTTPLSFLPQLGIRLGTTDRSAQPLPVYEYACRACGETEEDLQPLGRGGPGPCSACGGGLRRRGGRGGGEYPGR